MDKELKLMWGFLAVGIFSLFAMLVLAIASQFHGLPQGGFVIATAFVVIFASGMFIGAFVAAVDYMKVQLKLDN